MKLFWAAIAVVLSASNAGAQTTTLVFDGVTGTPLPVYSESGYTFTVNSGSTFGITDVGNPGGSYGVGLVFEPAIGDSVTLSNDAGNTFTFDALDAGSFNTFQSDQVTITGYLDGVVVGSFQVSTSAGQNFEAIASSLAGLEVDEVVISVSGLGDNSLLLDNISLSIFTDFAAILRDAIAGMMLSRGQGALAAQPDVSGNGGGGAVVSRGIGFTQAGGYHPVWVQLSAVNSTRDAAETQIMGGSVGVDVFGSDMLRAGVMLQFDDVDYVQGATQIDATGLMLGVYGTLEVPGVPVHVDARVLAGQTDNAVTLSGAPDGEFSTDRVLAQLGVSGDLGMGATRITPYARVGYVRDEQESYVNGSAATVPAQTLEFVEYTIGADFETTLPSVSEDFDLMGGIAIIATDLMGDSITPTLLPTAEDTRGRVSLGFEYASSAMSAVSVSAFYDGIGTDAYESTGVSLGLNLSF